MKDLTGKIILAVMVPLFLIFVFSGYKIFSYYKDLRREAKAFDELAQMVKAEKASRLLPEKTGILPQYAKLYEKNKDLFGWISIFGTEIDYPVMHTPDKSEFYLHKAFDKTDSKSGVPFLSADCHTGCGNYIIYGHNMNNGSMFASILKYEDKKYWEAHKIIKFDTLYEEGEYEVIAVFRAKLTENIKYWEYTDLTNEDDFNEYIKLIKDKAIYDTGLSAEFGEELLTLSTCSYHTDNGRFVAVAKKIK